MSYEIIGHEPEKLKVKTPRISIPLDKLKLRSWTETVNFDDVPSGTDITNHYPGVTFSTVAPDGRPVYAVARNCAKSKSNVVTLKPPSASPEFYAYDGAIKAQFETLQSTVSIDALAETFSDPLGPVLNRPFLEAWDNSGTLLGKVLYPIKYGEPGYGSWQTLSFSSPTTNIRYVLFSAQQTEGGMIVHGMFDNLSFVQRLRFIPAPD